MPDQTNVIGAWLLGALAAVWYATHPWAATGAAFGCCFFMAYPSATTGRQRWLMGVFSLGVGYAFGVFFYGEGPPYSNKAMLASASFAALAALIFTAGAAVIEKNGNLPRWLRSLITLFWPFKKGGGQP